MICQVCNLDKTKPHPVRMRFCLVEHRGLEPLTPTLPVSCAPSCANAPYKESSLGYKLLFSGGEGEIRTLEPLLTVTRFPVVRPRPTRRLLHEYCRHYRADSYMIPQKEEFVKGFLKKILKFCKKRAEGGNQLKQP